MRLRLTLASILVAGIFRAASAQDVALKTNALFWATTSPSLGAEIALAPQWTIDLSAAYNPWTFRNDKKMRFWLAQPEARYWFCEKFEGHFVGLHLHGAQCYGGFSDTRYDGYLAGGGFTYGYDWILSPHWNVEAAVGIGYAHLWYKESPCMECIKYEYDGRFNYVGLTKAAITFTYIF